MNTLQKNQLHTAKIEGYTSEAYGVCRLDGRAVFVPRALAGETWRIRIVKVTDTAVYARGEELLVPSPARRDPACPYFGKCGGCDTWHMSYEEELRFKLERVNSALTRIGKQTVHAEEIIGSDRITRYRNKGIFAVTDKDGEAQCGFFRERTHELIAVDACLIQNCRKAVKTDDAVICVVSAKGFGDHTPDLTDAIRKECPEATGIVLNINKAKGNTVLAGEFYSLWGRDSIVDTLCGSSFTISPQAFFQINPPQVCVFPVILRMLLAPRSSRRPLKTQKPMRRQTVSKTRSLSVPMREKLQKNWLLAD